MISPFDVSKRMNFKEPSFKASTTCLDLPIKEVTYAETSSVWSIFKLDLIGSPDESQIITPLTPSFSSNLRIIALTSLISIIFNHLVIFLIRNENY